jgi:phosphoglucosamine mutase
LLCLDKHSTGDGIVSALQVLSALQRVKVSLDEAVKDLELYPQSLVNVRVAAGTDWKANAVLVADKAAVEEELGDRGRVLIRASGTEPLIRVMVEADNADLAHACAHRLAAHLRG